MRKWHSVICGNIERQSNPHFRVTRLQWLLNSHQQNTPKSAEPQSMRQSSTPEKRPIRAMSTMSCNQHATTSPYVLKGYPVNR